MKKESKKTQDTDEEMRRRQPDLLWKTILEDVFEDFLRFVFPQADKIFDFSKGFEYLDKELIDINPNPREKLNAKTVDKLVKVHHWNGRQEWILVHIEIQSQRQPGFSKRMFHYYSGLSARHNRPITSIAILTYEERKKTPTHYSANFAGTSVEFKFNTLNVSAFTDKDLEDSDNVFALVLLVAKKAQLKGKLADRWLLKHKLALARLLYERGLFEKEKLRKVFGFMNHYVQFEKPEMDRIFNERFKTLTNKKDAMGILEYLAEEEKKDVRQEGLEEGLERKGLEIAKNMIVNSNHSDKEISAFTSVPVSIIKKMRSEIK